ncbi:hypothetical protein GWK47_052405 [Chionoecetes opilio]|uniref:Uncharacterized protein n=1 Tax=Chionoecetes opilio TaxID=41210 RepID=A0A8J4Y1Q1_CHIOP|nr:hypothetical protein GWK47_052405 [Chionoecetes opilio]
MGKETAKEGPGGPPVVATPPVMSSRGSKSCCRGLGVAPTPPHCRRGTQSTYPHWGPHLAPSAKGLAGLLAGRFFVKSVQQFTVPRRRDLCLVHWISLPPPVPCGGDGERCSPDPPGGRPHAAPASGGERAKGCRRAPKIPASTFKTAPYPLPNMTGLLITSTYRDAGAPHLP